MAVLKSACHSHACTPLAAPSLSGVRGRRLSRCSMVPRAQADNTPSVPAPKGVTQPPYQPTVPPATFGFVDNAERINSRAAMAIANKGLLELLGVTVGQGLGFEL